MHATDVMQSDPALGAKVASPQALPGIVGSSCAWTNADLSVADLAVALPDDVLAELRVLAADPKLRDGDPIDYRLDPAKLPRTQALLAGIRDRIDHGAGAAVLDRLPVEEWDERQGAAISYLLSSLIGLPIEQKWKGARYYHVRNTGARKGYGVRLSVTKYGFVQHTDGPWLHHLPDAITLSCLQQADVGGYSRLASLVQAHNRLRQRHPELLRRLYRDFWWDRQAEHAPGERLCNRLPVFERDDAGFRCRFNESYIRNGYKLLDERLDILGDEALCALRAELDRPDSWLEFRLARGQMLFLNNHYITHGRTAFEDKPLAPEAKRHMIRIWLRYNGDVTLEPSQPLV